MLAHVMLRISLIYENSENRDIGKAIESRKIAAILGKEVSGMNEYFEDAKKYVKD